MFIRNDELVTLDPIQKKITSRVSLSQIEKISIDKRFSDHGLSLFRISLHGGKVHLYVSKDTNEIVNSVASRLKQAAKSNADDEESYFRDDDPDDDAYEPYEYTIQSGYHRYQVFGIDSHGQFYPHTLGLFSHFIKHADGKSKKIFSQHTYSRIAHVDTSHTHKISIHYSSDQPYQFIVSREDHAEIVALLKGRAFLYELLSRGEFITQETPLFGELGPQSDASDFPSKFSFGTSTAANHDAYRFDPDMIQAMTVLSQQPGLVPSAAPLFETQEVFLDDESFLSVDAHVNRIKVGLQVWKHIRKKSGKQPRLRFARVHDDLTISWGKSRKVDKNRRVPILDLITGPDAQKPQSKANASYSFLIKSSSESSDLYFIARDANEFENWTQGIRALLSKRKHDPSFSNDPPLTPLSPSSSSIPPSSSIASPPNPLPSSPLTKPLPTL